MSGQPVDPRVADVDADEQLTDAGWPRPVYAGMPVPWVSPQGNLAQMNLGRYQAAASGAICLVCGLGFQVGATAWALVKKEPAQTAADLPHNGTAVVTPMDNAVMHERCWRLAVASCPVLRGLVVTDELLSVGVRPNAGQVEVDEPGAAARCVMEPDDWWHLEPGPGA